MAIYQRFSDPDWIMLVRKQAAQFHGRSSAMFGIPNSFAALLELVIPVCLTLLFSRAVKVSTKIICGWLAGLGLAALALTGSRGGWLGLTLALLIWPLLATRHWQKKLAGAAIVAGLIFGGFWALYRGSDYAQPADGAFSQRRIRTQPAEGLERRGEDLAGSSVVGDRSRFLQRDVRPIPSAPLCRQPGLGPQ